MKNKDRSPIYYGSVDEMDKPVSELVNELRNELVCIRGKIFDVRYSCGWKEQLEYIEGGLTCLIVSMYHQASEIENFEERVARQKAMKVGEQPTTAAVPQ